MGTASSHRSYPPGRGQRKCAAGAYWPGQTLLTYGKGETGTEKTFKMLVQIEKNC